MMEQQVVKHAQLGRLVWGPPSAKIAQQVDTTTKKLKPSVNLALKVFTTTKKDGQRVKHAPQEHTRTK